MKFAWVRIGSLWFASVAILLHAQVPFATLPVYVSVSDNTNPNCNSTVLSGALPASSYTGGTIYVVNTGGSIVATCRSNGSSWITTSSSGSGGVSSITFSPPLSGTATTGSITASLPASSNSQNGYLSSANFTSFNNRLGDPGSNGIVKRTALVTSAPALASDVVALFSTCSGTQYLGADGACHTIGAGSGTVTTFSAGNLSPLFTSVVTNPTTTPALAFTISNQNANQFFAGPSSGPAAAPTFRGILTADLPASGVTAGSYTSANITVDATGRVTTASNGTGGAGGYTTVDINGTPLTQRNTLNFISGTGITQACVDNGATARTDCTPSINTAVVPTISASQGNLQFCNSTNGTTAYTCTFAYAGSAALTTYGTGGLMIVLRVDTSNTGGCSVNIDTIGAVAIKQNNGTSDPASGAITAGRFYFLFYDGTTFRMQ